MRVMDGSGGMPSWNHAEFRVRYPSLANQLAVSGVYIKLLLDGLDQVTGSGPPTQWNGRQLKRSDAFCSSVIVKYICQHFDF
jgi:hypothetical protein